MREKQLVRLITDRYQVQREEEREREGAGEERNEEIDKVPTRAAIMSLQIGHWGALFLAKKKKKNAGNTQ